MHHVLMIVTVGNSMTWKYVMPVDIENSVLEVKWFTPSVLEKASEILIHFRQEDTLTVRRLSYRSNAGDIYHFNLLEEDELDLDRRTMTIDYTGMLRLMPVEQGEREAYLQKALFENMQEYNSTASKIHRSLLAEAPENRSLLKFMLELNSKLDDVLELLRGDERFAGFKLVQGVGLSAESLIFHDESVFPDGSLAYTNNHIGDGEDRVKFSALTEITMIKPAQTGWFYSANFINLKSEAVDSIVKYLFAKERDMIKGLREL